MLRAKDHQTYETVRDRAGIDHLAVFGAFHPTDKTGMPADTQTLMLLGPDEPGFWRHVSNEPELRDGNPDPIDRWSERVITALAKDVGGIAIFPFGGPAYAPFVKWASASGRAWSSPVSLLVHDEAGILVSYRGAIALPQRIAIPIPGGRPCDSCATKPCKTSCPASALTDAGYDLKACHEFLDAPEGTECMENGCAVRRSCPVSQSYGRLPAQSAHHMKAFHPCRSA